MEFSDFKKILFSLLLIFTYGHQTFGQYNVVKVDFFGGVLSPLKVFRPSFERSFGESFSGALTFERGLFAKSETHSGYTLTQSTALKAWGIIPEFRYYPGNKNDAPIGFFVGTHLIYRNLSEEYNYGQQAQLINKGYFLSLGGHVGYKIPLGRLNLELLGGYGSAYGKYKSPMVSPPEIEADDPSLPIRFEISLGFIFPRRSVETTTKKSVSLSWDRGETNGENAKIVIYRPRRTIGFSTEYLLLINDRFLTRIKNGTYYECELPGNQEIIFSAKTEVPETLRLKVEKGKTYYFKSGIKMGVLEGRPSFEIIPQDKALKEIKRLQ